VALGGAVGAVARHLVSLCALAALGPAFPWGTLVANVAGSFLIGFWAEQAEAGRGPAATVAGGALLLTGFCGGFTTLSIFGLETPTYVRADRTDLALAYAGGSAAVWLGAAALGRSLGRGGG
jgi:CrcB protein